MRILIKNCRCRVYLFDKTTDPDHSRKSDQAQAAPTPEDFFSEFTRVVDTGPDLMVGNFLLKQIGDPVFIRI